MKLLQLLTVILFFFSGIELSGQSPRFEQEGFNYYWNAGQLISLHTPVYAIGVEYKTDYRLSLAFDTGLGTFRSTGSDSQASLFHRDVSNWVAMKSNVYLKYYRKFRYNKFKLNLWRKRNKKGKKTHLLNPPHFKNYFGLHIGHETNTYRTQDGVYSAQMDNQGGRTLVYYKKAAVASVATKFGLMLGWQGRIKQHHRYVEVATIIGIRIDNVKYFNVENNQTPPTPGFSAFLSSLFYRPIDFNEGRTTAPYTQVIINFGLFK